MQVCHAVVGESEEAGADGVCSACLKRVYHLRENWTFCQLVNGSCQSINQCGIAAYVLTPEKSMRKSSNARLRNPNVDHRAYDRRPIASMATLSNVKASVTKALAGLITPDLSLDQWTLNCNCLSPRRRVTDRFQKCESNCCLPCIESSPRDESVKKRMFLSRNQNISPRAPTSRPTMLYHFFRINVPRTYPNDLKLREEQASSVINDQFK